MNEHSQSQGPGAGVLGGIIIEKTGQGGNLARLIRLAWQRPLQTLAESKGRREEVIDNQYQDSFWGGKKNTFLDLRGESSRAFIQERSINPS